MTKTFLKKLLKKTSTVTTDLKDDSEIKGLFDMNDDYALEAINALQIMQNNVF